MVIRITVEAIVYSLLYTAFMLVLFRIQGAKYQLYNYPPAIKARAIEKGITTQAELDAHAKKNRVDRKSTRLNSSHYQQSRMPSSA